MRPARVAALTFALAVTSALAPTAAEAQSPARRPARALPPDSAAAESELPAPVLAALARAKLPRESLVAYVAAVEPTARPRLAAASDRPVNPASLFKLVTTYAALELLGPAWTWRTPVWLDGALDGAGVLTGNVVIKGSGDPTLVLERAWLLLRRIRQLGVREIRGDIVLDRSALRPAPTDPAEFDGEPLRPYNVGADALLLNFRAVAITLTPMPARGVAAVSVDPPLAGVRLEPAAVPLTAGPCDDWRAGLAGDLSDPERPVLRGSYPLSCGERSWNLAWPEPGRYDERLITALWQESGGRLTGRVRDGRAPATAPTFESTSPPLAQAVRDINKLSNNVMAQQLFLTLDAQRGGAGDAAGGANQLMRFLGEKLGPAADGSVVANGSGLSRETRLAARALGRLLQAAWASPVMPEYIASLPVTGTDGTARRATGAIGRAHLKTGSLRDVAGIAGYVLGDSGRRWVVVGIVNHPQPGGARPVLDALVNWAADDTREPR